MTRTFCLLCLLLLLSFSFFGTLTHSRLFDRFHSRSESEHPVSNSSDQCPSSSLTRCMTETRVRCINKTEGSTDYDRWCCGDLVCVPLFIPSTDTQSANMTTECVSMSVNVNVSVGVGVGVGVGVNEKSKTKTTKRHAVIPTEDNDITPPLPPVLPKFWAAPNVTTFNITDSTFGRGTFYFNQDYGAIRNDFEPICPFKQIWQIQPGVDALEANYAPCTVLFYEGYNYYVYPQSQLTCKYKFPVCFFFFLFCKNHKKKKKKNRDGETRFYAMVTRLMQEFEL